jgi:hypothetical protein
VQRTTRRTPQSASRGDLRPDSLVAQRLVFELKTVDRLAPIHLAQATSTATSRTEATAQTSLASSANPLAFLAFLAAHSLPSAAAAETLRAKGARAP